jgi:hypothetical protein
MSFVPVTVGINIKIVNLLFCEGIHKFLIRELFNKIGMEIREMEIEWIVAKVTIIVETQKAIANILYKIEKTQEKILKLIKLSK